MEKIIFSKFITSVTGKKTKAHERKEVGFTARIRQDIYDTSMIPDKIAKDTEIKEEPIQKSIEGTKQEENSLKNRKETKNVDVVKPRDGKPHKNAQPERQHVTHGGKEDTLRKHCKT